MPSSTADADDQSATPYFRRDGNHFIPTEIARGGWGPTLSGHITGGLLSWAAEQTVDDPASLTHSSHDRVAAGSAVLVDRTGPIGSGVSIAIAHSGFRAPSTTVSD